MNVDITALLMVLTLSFATNVLNKSAASRHAVWREGGECNKRKRAFFGYFAASESSGELRFGKLKRYDHSHEVTTAADATR